jgi:hypothetical protein
MATASESTVIGLNESGEAIGAIGPDGPIGPDGSEECGGRGGAEAEEGADGSIGSVGSVGREGEEYREDDEEDAKLFVGDAKRAEERRPWRRFVDSSDLGRPRVLVPGVFPAVVGPRT